ncbi:MAG TPA: fibronectin type III domain-containing protein [Terriglobales bacterium]|jgi:phosphodiesterase/alkaline phosphatase D-like protein|nr:fibronectin type III domain-containing protein [Terriglobales bacterium]
MKRELAFLAALLVLGLGTILPAQSWPDHEPQDSSQNEPLVVAGPIPEKITSTSALVWWQTTTPEESILVYGTAPNDQRFRVQRPWRTTTHEVSVKKLQPATTYYLGILKSDGSRSAVGQFTTQPVGYTRDNNVRITNGPLFEQITPDSATIAWSTNRSSSSLVRYGPDPQHLDRTAKAPWSPATHRVVLRDLQSDTRYFFSIESSQPGEDSAGDSGADQPSATSAPPAQLYSFRTLSRGQQALNIGPQH